MATESFTFAGHSGHDLAARLDLPEGTPVATAIFAHCFTCSKDIPASRRIAKRLAAMGVAVLRFDFTGLGHSGGEFANTHFSSNVEDLLQAAAALKDRGQAPAILIGHSLGGAAVLKAAANLPSVKAVVTIGAPADPSHVTHNFGDALPDIVEAGEAEVALAGRPFTIRKSFLDDIARSELTPAIRDLRKALLVLHSPVDDTVGIENASEIFMAARHPKSFVTLDNADHLLTSPRDADYAAEVISAWVRRYLRITPPAAPIGAPEGVVRVSEVSPNAFQQNISAGPRHFTRADEPKAFGGNDAGMSPYQFLSAGLGACTSMTIRMYARRKNWPLEDIQVDVVHNSIHASDCEHCQSTDGMIDAFERRITLSGPLSDDQRARLLEIANKCPVHRTLEGEVAIRTSLAPA
ncbi:bifunctional alpha/beta hydrolase/OsmC family protein [Algicella marina]|uniref:Alpha/beta fold hydrolase n=1 Tax=Algicella marina TaxID=2683284 RepID=A0A6P1T0D6_9RHOB|nr:bifunctional alpha/beta hydrolase/OsmC family protein [Algicella marina]QHQ34749.1 alpha/beta fold hydrolase [Algicella marina]